MKLVKFFAVFVFGSLAMSASAASFDCVAPEFPSVSTSSEGVRRVDKQVKAWRACYAANSAEHGSLEVARMNDQVEASLEKWIAATRAYSNGQAVGAGTLSRVERDRVEQMSARAPQVLTTSGARQP